MVKDTCLCKMDVHKATVIIGIFQFLAHSVVIALLFMQNDGPKSVPVLNETLTELTLDKLFIATLMNDVIVKMSVAASTVCVVVILLFGIFTDRPSLFWPYLAFKFVYLVALTTGTAFLLSLALIALYLPSLLVFEAQESYAFGMTLAKISIFLLLLDLYGIYFEYWIVNQSRLVLIEDKQLNEVTPVEPFNDEENEEKEIV